MGLLPASYFRHACARNLNHVNVSAVSGMRVLVFKAQRLDTIPAACAFVHKNSVELGVQPCVSFKPGFA